MPPRQGRGHRHGPGPHGPHGPGPRRGPAPGPFWFPFWRPIGPGERMCWLCFWMSPPAPAHVYEEHHHYYEEPSSSSSTTTTTSPPPAPVYTTEPIIVEAFIQNPTNSNSGYREIYTIDYKPGDNPEKFYVQVPSTAIPGTPLECRLGGKQTRVLLPKDIVLGSTIIVITKR